MSQRHFFSRLALSRVLFLPLAGACALGACVEAVDRGSPADNGNPQTNAPKTPAPSIGNVPNPGPSMNASPGLPATPAPMPQPLPAIDPQLPVAPPASYPPLEGRPTPPLSGGTLLVLADGKHAVAADPDFDVVHFADLDAKKALGTLALQGGDEPGRAVQDGKGRVHLVLRGGGAVATIDPATRKLEQRRAVCPAPRGIAFDRATDRLLIACAGGELVSLPTGDGAAELRARLPRDLRDVVITSNKVLVSQFRSADVFEIAADGKMLATRRPPGSPPSRQPVPPMSLTPGETAGVPPNAATPNVAWRMVATPDGGAMMVHQEGGNGELGTERGGYAGGPCKNLIGTAVTTISPEGTPSTSGQLMFSNLPVDLALSRDGKDIAIVSAGNASGGNGPAMFPGRGMVVTYMRKSVLDQSGCMFGGMLPPPDTESGQPIEFRQPTGQAIAVAFDGQGRVVAQLREPARLEILSKGAGSIALATAVRGDVGHTIFHQSTSFGISCAGCHPEAGDDARTWRFEKIGTRRTQTLRGGILDTAPFHWDGDMNDLAKLMQTVFVGRMGGAQVSDPQLTALGSWMNALPHLPGTAGDAAAVARGKGLFESDRVGCAKCHTGKQLTNNQSMDVGTGKALQVPSLRGIAWRAPFMHTGCAPTLADRFGTSCGGGDKHGVTSQLSQAEIGDLVSYMESL